MPVVVYFFWYIFLVMILVALQFTTRPKLGLWAVTDVCTHRNTLVGPIPKVQIIYIHMVSIMSWKNSLVSASPIGSYLVLSRSLSLIVSRTERTPVFPQWTRGAPRQNILVFTCRQKPVNLRYLAMQRIMVGSDSCRVILYPAIVAK